MVNQKGQEAAPFELLIAVILMGFVIIIGTYASMELERQKSEQQINQKLEDFKEALEAVSKGKGQYNLEFVLPPHGRNQEINLLQISDSYRCSIYCGGSRATCTIVTFEAEGAKSMAKCVNISPLTGFKGEKEARDTGGPCPSYLTDDLLCLEDWRSGPIKQGDYVLASAYTTVITPVPIICAYRKAINEDDCDLIE